MKIFCLMLMMILNSVASAQNHLPGLHMQIDNTVIDFNRTNVQEAILFSEGEDRSGIVIRLNLATAQKLQHAMQKSLGQTALWIWDGKIISTYKITGLVDDSLTVFNLPKKAAELFVNSVHS